ncbi:Fanconi anemia core complex-associated protein 24-like isoform X2 [Ptychodera flava]|uniref:Fanconi anemia core complex-associated protein 24-like isoform X2 n=1 Tax=Ptychodera flava TaxID=63121 RepID=UPI00396A9D82
MKHNDGKIKVSYEDDLGVVDFHPSSDTAIIYVSENDIIAGHSYRRRLVKLRKANSMKGVVLVEKTPVSQQYFSALQKFVVLELGMVLLYITSQTEAGNLLIQMVDEENKPSPNPFRTKRKVPPIDQAVLTTVQMIPKLGGVKARALLERFGSIKGIVQATDSELASVIGRSNTTHVRAFFNHSMSDPR